MHTSILQVLVESRDDEEGKEGNEAVLVHDNVLQKSNNNCSALLGLRKRVGGWGWGWGETGE